MSYHHGNLREALIEVARRVVEEQGHTKLSLRACAREVGVDIAAAYRHFSNKDMVLASVATAGFHQLGRQMYVGMGARRVERARAYFEGAGRGYVAFGRAHPHLYRLMFGGGVPAHLVYELLEQTPDEHDANEVLSDALDLLMEAGEISATAREGADPLAWAMIHGVVSFLLESRETPDPGALTHRACVLLVDGLATKHGDTTLNPGWSK